MFLKILVAIPVGAAAGIAAVTMLPVFGAAGTITAVGTVVGTTLGGSAAVIDKIIEEE